MKYIYVVCSLFFILIFDLWVENSDQAQLFYENWLKPVIDESNVPLIWFLLIIVFFAINFKYWSDRKNEEIGNLNIKIESEMEILIQANAELSGYRLKDNLSKLLEQLIIRKKMFSNKSNKSLLKN